MASDGNIIGLHTATGVVKLPPFASYRQLAHSQSINLEQNSEFTLSTEFLFRLHWRWVRAWKFMRSGSLLFPLFSKLHPKARMCKARMCIVFRHRRLQPNQGM